MCYDLIETNNLQAYYMLTIKTRLNPGDNVLIHAGCSSIGLAAILVASSFGCNVFTTVFDLTQKDLILKKFSFVSILVLSS